MLNKLLESLVSIGAVKDYVLTNVDKDGNVGKKSNCRNTERLTLELNSGHVLCIDTICSGCLEDTKFIISLIPFNG